MFQLISSGQGNGNPFQYSCLKNFMDRGAWPATVHGVTKSQTQLGDQHTHNRSRWGSAIWICIRLQVRWAWLPAAVWVQVNFIYVLAGAQASRTRHILRTSGRIPGDWAELHENYMKNGAERMLSRARTLYKHKDRHTWFIVLCLIAFFTNWKFVATLLWASLSAPWFQQHFLITSCLCVTFW